MLCALALRYHIPAAADDWHRGQALRRACPGRFRAEPVGSAGLAACGARVELHMARNRTPQTFEKRRREMEKQTKRNAKIEQRHARKAAKRELAAQPPTPLADLSAAVPKPDPAPPAPAPEGPNPTNQEH